MEVVKFCATHIGQKDKIFDASSFKRALDRYEGDDLVLGSGGGRIDYPTPNELQAEVLAVKLAEGVTSSLQGSFTKEALTENLIDTLSDLQRAKANGWATFVPPKPEPEQKAKGQAEPRSSWEIRMIFMIDNPKLPDDFRAVVAIIGFSANIKDEADWSELKGDAVKRFSYYINRTNLVVTKGFKSFDIGKINLTMHTTRLNAENNYFFF